MNKGNKLFMYWNVGSLDRKGLDWNVEPETARPNGPDRNARPKSRVTQYNIAK